MATAKQKAAARKNIKKAQAALRKKNRGHTKTTRKAERRGKGKASAKQRAAARKNIKKAQAANRRDRKSTTKSPRKRAKRAKAEREREPKRARKSGRKGGGRRKSGRKGGGRRKSGRRSSGRATAHTTRTEIIKMPGHTTKVAILPIQSGARRSGKRKGGKRKGGKRKGGKRRSGKRGGSRARETGYAMENPLTGVELFVGGLTGLLGFGVADVLDRYLATHALTAGTNASVGGYPSLIDTPPTSGVYSGLFNATAIIAPMGLLRWGVGLGLTAVPLIAAHWIKAPTGRSALQFFGFGVGFRVVGKGMQDLFAYMFKSTSFGLRLYDGEVRAWAMKSGQLSFVAGTSDESGALAGAFPAAGLGDVPRIGCGKCANCLTGVGSCCMKGKNGPTPTAAAAPPPPPPPPPPPAQTPAPSPTWVPTPSQSNPTPTRVASPPSRNIPFPSYNPNPAGTLPGGTTPQPTYAGTQGVPSEARRSKYQWGSSHN